MEARSLALRVKKLYDGTLGAPLEDAILVYRNGIIQDVFPACSEEARQKLAALNPELIDYRNLYMTPGLIDMHTHLMMPGDGTFLEDEVAACHPGEMQVLAYTNAMSALRRGITTLRDCGGGFDIPFGLKRYLSRPEVIGPDLSICGAPLTVTGGHCHLLGGEVDGETEIRKFVRLQQKKGADFVKIMSTSGGTKGSPKGETFTRDELAAAIDEAHRRQMPAVAHVFSLELMWAMLGMGIDGFEHSTFMPPDCSVVIRDKELAAAIREKEIFVSHTLTMVCLAVPFYEEKVRRGTATAADIADMDFCRRFHEKVMESFAFQVEEKLPIVVGTDSGWRLANFDTTYNINLKLMEEGGMAPLDLIHAATGRGAKALGLSNKLGTLTPGLQADFLLLSKDPGEGASAFGALEKVVKKGREVPLA